MRNLVVGRLSFCNVMPFFWQTFDGISEVDFVNGVPKYLNDQLRNGIVDLAPSSSIAYALDFDKMVIHPRLCIAGSTKVLSVALFSNYSFKELHDKSVGITNESETSVALLKVLCALRYHCSPRFEIKNSDAIYDAELIIGDEALIQKKNNKYALWFDLGAEWYDWTTLPFVFALWICRKDAYTDITLVAKIRNFMRLITESLNTFNNDQNSAIIQWRNYVDVALSDQELKNYFSSMEYLLTPLHMKSLHMFFGYCVEIGVLHTMPEMNYIE